ncbi:hypothetical protein BB561_003946 [Smittium simulii]|uniref:Uncharacterized protein n=1 Tax=Smittium simulii TaxID=133385 RepID=A0A2T9YIW3_9FUNG|nr:hypothetical protein BB561_003946 [Smittium simulii]
MLANIVEINNNIAGSQNRLPSYNESNKKKIDLLYKSTTRSIYEKTQKDSILKESNKSIKSTASYSPVVLADSVYHQKEHLEFNPNQNHQYLQPYDNNDVKLQYPKYKNLANSSQHHKPLETCAIPKQLDFTSSISIKKELNAPFINTPHLHQKLVSPVELNPATLNLHKSPSNRSLDTQPPNVLKQIELSPLLYAVKSGNMSVDNPQPIYALTPESKFRSIPGSINSAKIISSSPSNKTKSENKIDKDSGVYFGQNNSSEEELFKSTMVEPDTDQCTLDHIGIDSKYNSPTISLAFPHFKSTNESISGTATLPKSPGNNQRLQKIEHSFLDSSKSENLRNSHFLSQTNNKKITSNVNNFYYSKINDISSNTDSKKSKNNGLQVSDTQLEHIEPTSFKQGGLYIESIHDFKSKSNSVLDTKQSSPLHRVKSQYFIKKSNVSAQTNTAFSGSSDRNRLIISPQMTKNSKSNSILLRPEYKSNNVSTSSLKTIKSCKKFGMPSKLIGSKDGLEMYRSVAKKTNNPEIQIAYLKYLMDLVDRISHESCSNTEIIDPCNKAFKSSMGQSFDTSIDISEVNNNQDLSLSTINNRSSASNFNSRGVGNFSQVTRVESNNSIENLTKEIAYWASYFEKKGGTEANYILGTIYEYGKYGYQPNKKKALSFYFMATKAHHAKSSYKVGLYHEKAKNYEKSLGCYLYAANQSVPEANYKLAKCYLYGKLNQKISYKLALVYLKRSSELSSTFFSKGAFLLGKLYLGEFKDCTLYNDLIMDKPEGIRLIEHAANLGSSKAMCKIGTFYEHGVYGYDIDINAALKYFMLASSQNNSEAKYILAQYYTNGDNNNQNIDYSLAFKYSHQAAELGNAEAMALVANLYINGFGIDQSYSNGKFWLKKAIKLGNSNAEKVLKSLKKNKSSISFFSKK